MTPEQHTLALKYLMQRLQPEDQQELKSLLGEEDMSDIAEDALKGRIAMDRLSPRLQRQALARITTQPDHKSFYENFPDAARIKVLR